MDYDAPISIKPQTGQPYCIAAWCKHKPQRFLIKVSNLATREGLLKEIKRMNGQPHCKFVYCLSTEGATI